MECNLKMHFSHGCVMYFAYRVFCLRKKRRFFYFFLHLSIFFCIVGNQTKKNMMKMATQKQDKTDKRAAALRDNLKRRKAKAKADKNQSKEEKDGTSADK